MTIPSVERTAGERRASLDPRDDSNMLLDGEGASGKRSVQRRARRAMDLAVIVGIAPFVALLISQLVHLRYRSTVATDWAVLSLQVRDAEHMHLLLGPYSRVHWNHPGPVYAYFLVPFFWLSGQQYGGLAAGVAALNLICAALILLLVRAAATRTERRPVLAVWAAAAALVSFVAIFGPEYLRVPWTPLAVILPITLVGVAGIALLCRVRWALPVAAGAATFALQTHFATAPVVGVLAVVTVVPALWRFRQTLRSWAVTALAAVILLAAMWALPVYEQVTRSPGNMTLMWRYFTGPKQGGNPPLVQAIRFASIQVTVSSGSLGKWVSQSLPRFPPFDLWRQVVLGLALVLLAGLWAWGQLRRHPLALGFGRTSLFAAAAAVLAVHLVIGPFSPYLSSSSSSVGILVLLAVAVGAVSVIGAYAPAATRRGGLRTLALVMVLTLCAGSVVLCVQSARLPAAAQETSDPAVAQLASAARHVLPAGVGHPTVLIDLCGWLPNNVGPPWELATGVANQLEIHGAATTVNPSWTFMFGARRAATGHEEVHLVFVHEEQPDAGLVQPLPRASRLLASVNGTSMYLVPPGVPLLGP